MYHNVCPVAKSIWDVSGDQLARHVQSMLDQGLRFGGLDDILGGRDGMVALTFDDGYANVYENALPILSSFNIPATVFVPVNFVGGMNTYDCLCEFGLRRPERIMTWSQLADLVRAGWLVQSHGCSHLPLDSLLPAHIEDEVRRSKCALEDRLGAEVTAFSYPFGILPQLDREFSMEDLLERSGYQLAVVAGGGNARTAAGTLPCDQGYGDGR